MPTYSGSLTSQWRWRKDAPEGARCQMAPGETVCLVQQQSACWLGNPCCRLRCGQRAGGGGGIAPHWRGRRRHAGRQWYVGTHSPPPQPHPRPWAHAGAAEDPTRTCTVRPQNSPPEPPLVADLSPRPRAHGAAVPRLSTCTDGRAIGGRRDAPYHRPRQAATAPAPEYGASCPSPPRAPTPPSSDLTLGTTGCAALALGVGDNMHQI